ncbi:hypothetical protein D5R81_08045 [Parashewanella spongiae]|uniref:Uncharacterized protein n=1 Tax=Parashewanella spongiae TaxID=342950 RepID=A0A3A6U0Q5_9GAMM|nr:ankyrin repeat domain-containing protein [Parashewanella spongiae]MCL1077909.1 ankyrin repeat domain-containing protein [Parashewanella spongiae]RJY17554.1 hypothetical protein D5R81_08045 [Parashewanella spongiae]
MFESSSTSQNLALAESSTTNPLNQAIIPFSEPSQQFITSLPSELQQLAIEHQPDQHTLTHQIKQITLLEDLIKDTSIPEAIRVIAIKQHQVTIHHQTGLTQHQTTMAILTLVMEKSGLLKNAQAVIRVLLFNEIELYFQSHSITQSKQAAVIQLFNTACTWLGLPPKAEAYTLTLTAEQLDSFQAQLNTNLPIKSIIKAIADEFAKQLVIPDNLTPSLPDNLCILFTKNTSTLDLIEVHLSSTTIDSLTRLQNDIFSGLCDILLITKDTTQLPLCPTTYPRPLAQPIVETTTHESFTHNNRGTTSERVQIQHREFVDSQTGDRTSASLSVSVRQSVQYQDGEAVIEEEVVTRSKITTSLRTPALEETKDELLGAFSGSTNTLVMLDSEQQVYIMEDSQRRELFAQDLANIEFNGMKKEARRVIIHHLFIKTKCFEDLWSIITTLMTHTFISDNRAQKRLQVKRILKLEAKTLKSKDPTYYSKFEPLLLSINKPESLLLLCEVISYKPLKKLVNKEEIIAIAKTVIPSNNKEALNILLALKINLNFKINQVPVLFYLIRQKHFELAEQQIKRDETIIEATDPNQNNIIHLLASCREFVPPELMTYILFNTKTDVNSVNRFGRTAVHLAVMSENSATINLLLTHPLIDSNISDSFGMTPLLIAIQKDSCLHDLISHEGIQTELSISSQFKYLENEESADENSSAEDKLTPTVNPFIYAIEKHKATAFLALIERAPNLKNTQISEYGSLLHHAIHMGSLEIAQALIKRDKQLINTQNKFGDTPLFFAIKNKKHLFYRTLLTTEYDKSIPAKDGSSLLVIAAYYGLYEMVNTVSKTHPELLTHANDAGFTPFLAACRTGKTQCIEYLSNRIDVLAHRSVAGENGLHLAIKYGHVSACKKLLALSVQWPKLTIMDKGAQKEISLIGFSIFHNQHHILNLLIRLGSKANPNHVLISINQNSPDCFKILLATPYIVQTIDQAKTSKGLTAVHLAAQLNRLDMIKQLKQRHLPLDEKVKFPADFQIPKPLCCEQFELKCIMKNGHYFSPLHLAVLNNSLEVAEFLLSNNCDVNAHMHGELLNFEVLTPTPLYCAAFSGFDKMVRLLLKFKADKAVHFFRYKSSQDRVFHFAVDIAKRQHQQVTSREAKEKYSQIIELLKVEESNETLYEPAPS